jgi:hypothetical membrane protein
VPVRLGAACGLLGPTAFVGAWLVGGLLTDGYDPVGQAISQLAREGAATRPLMTGGLVAFGLLVPVWAVVLGRRLGSRPVRFAATTAGLATLAVAALPLTREPGGTQDLLHALAAAVGYLAMALTPLLAVPALRRAGRPGAAAASAVVGVVSATALVASLLVPGATGALQRLGLTVVDGWHVVAALLVLRSAAVGRSGPS